MKNVRFIAISGVVSIVAISFCGCNESDRPLRHQGKRIDRNGDVEQIVAHIPSPDRLPSLKNVTLKIYKTIASVNQPDVITLEFESKSSLLLKTTIFDGKQIRLSINDKCGSGDYESYALKLCWSETKLDFEVTVKGSQNLYYALYLLRDDALASLTEVSGSPHEYSLDELLGRAKFLNYAVAQEAERVFQAKENIRVKLGQLLPGFNMRDLLAFATGGPMGLIGSVGTLLPFLFPSNWFKWEESKQLFEAEKKAFSSLVGNEIQATEVMYYLLLRDLALLNLADRYIEWLGPIQELIKTREQAGTLQPGSTDLFVSTVVELLQDREQLKLLTENERHALSQAVALPSRYELLVSEPRLPDLLSVDPIDAKEFFADAKAKSLETATLDFLIIASRSATQEKAFSFLDPSSDGTIGFGYAATLRVSRSQTRELERRKEEVLSRIEQRSADTASEYNIAIRSFELSDKGRSSSQNWLDRLIHRLSINENLLAEPGFTRELTEAMSQVLKFRANQLSAAYLNLMAKSKLNRLLLTGPYQGLDAALPLSL